RGRVQAAHRGGDDLCPGQVAGQLRLRSVAALPAGPAAEQAGPVAEDGDDDVGVAGRLHRGDDAGDVPVVDAGAAGDREVGGGELVGEGVGQGRQVDADGHVRVLHAHVQGEGVAAQYGGRLGGARADQGDAAGPGERQGAVVGEQDDGLLGQL